jgi:hypothetical protein
MVDFRKMLKKSRVRGEIIDIIIRAHEDPNYTNDELIKDVDNSLNQLIGD